MAVDGGLKVALEELRDEANPRALAAPATAVPAARWQRPSWPTFEVGAILIGVLGCSRRPLAAVQRRRARARAHPSSG